MNQRVQRLFVEKVCLHIGRFWLLKLLVKRVRFAVLALNLFRIAEATDVSRENPSNLQHRFPILMKACNFQKRCVTWFRNLALFVLLMTLEWDLHSGKCVCISCSICIAFPSTSPTLFHGYPRVRRLLRNPSSSCYEGLRLNSQRTLSAATRPQSSFFAFTFRVFELLN